MIPLQDSATQWLPAIVMAVIGVIAGGVLAFRAYRRKSAAAITTSEDLVFADLQARRDALVEQLRDPALDPEEREALEREAAQVLREIDRRGSQVTKRPATEAPAAAAAPASAAASSVRGFLWGAGTIAIVALIVLAVQRSATPRTDTAGGNAPMQGAPGAPGASDAELEQLQQQAQADPNNLELRIDLARAFLVRDRLMDVYEQTQYVLERNPDNPRALSYQALVRMAMGETQRAEQMLKRAIQIDPNSLEAYVHLALVYANVGNNAGAQQTIQEAIKRHPQERERLESLLVQLQAPAGQMPAGAAPAPPPAPASSGAPAGGVEVMLELAAGKTVSPSAMLFVSARPEGVSEGAPIAVKRMRVPTFPIRLTIGPEDAMMGGQLSEKLRIDARIDSDGDPMSRDPNDPKGFVDGIALGSSGVRIILR